MSRRPRLLGAGRATRSQRPLIAAANNGNNRCPGTCTRFRPTWPPSCCPRWATPPSRSSLSPTRGRHRPARTFSTPGGEGGKPTRALMATADARASAPASSSESNDLAVRIARARFDSRLKESLAAAAESSTGGRGSGASSRPPEFHVAVLQGGYHGHLVSTIALRWVTGRPGRSNFDSSRNRLSFSPPGAALTSSRARGAAASQATCTCFLRPM